MCIIIQSDQLDDFKAFEVTQPVLIKISINLDLVT